MWINIVEPSRSQMTVRRMRIACWIPKTTDTNLEYLILYAFPLLQWLQDRVSMLRHTYIAGLVCDVYMQHICHKIRLFVKDAFSVCF